MWSLAVLDMGWGVYSFYSFGSSYNLTKGCLMWKDQQWFSSADKMTVIFLNNVPRYLSPVRLQLYVYQMVGQGVRIRDDEFQHIIEEKYWQDCLKVEAIYLIRSKYCLILKGGQTSPVHLVFVKLKKKLHLLIICTMINHIIYCDDFAVL